MIFEFGLEEDEHGCVDPHPSPNLASNGDSVSPARNQKTRSFREIYAQSQFEEPPHALTTTEPVMPGNCYMALALDPQTYGEATANPLWEVVMQEEYNSLPENQTWDLVPLPSDRKLVRCKWVYRTKKAVDGQGSMYKERLVAKGF